MSQSQRKSTRLEAKPTKTWHRNGACGIKEPSNPTNQQTVKSNPSSAPSGPSRAKFNNQTTAENLLFDHKDYDTSDKYLPMSQPLQVDITEAVEPRNPSVNPT